MPTPIRPDLGVQATVQTTTDKPMHKTLALLVRALRTESRDIKSHLFRFGLAGVVVLILLMGLSAMQYESAPGRVMFKAMTWANWVVVTLAGGTIFAIAISEETEQQTLGLLRMANVSPLSLLLGKWLPRMLTAIVLISIQFPFTWLTVTLGGVSWQQIWASYLMLLAHLILIGNLGLLCSVLKPTSAQACTLTIGLMILSRLLPAIVWAVIAYAAESGWASQATSLWFRDEVVLPLNLWSASGRLFGEILSTSFQGDAWSPQVISNLAMGAVLFVVAWLIFDPVTMRHMSGGSERRSLRSRILGLFTRKTRKAGAVWNWALGWKDFQQVGGGRWSVIGKFGLYGALFVTILYINSQYSRDYRRSWETSCGVLAWITLFVLLPLDLCATAAKLFRPELTDHTWSTLLTLPKSLPEIAYSKLGGALLGLIPSVSVLCLSGAPFLGEFLPDMSRHPESFLVVAYLLAAVLVALHLVTFFSISINWAAWPIAMILGVGVTFFGNVLIWTLFGIAMMGIGAGGGEATMYAWLMLLTLGQLILAGVTHYGIGLRLVAKGAEN